MLHSSGMREHDDMNGECTARCYYVGIRSSNSGGYAVSINITSVLRYSNPGSANIDLTRYYLVALCAKRATFLYPGYTVVWEYEDEEEERHSRGSQICRLFLPIKRYRERE